MAFGILYIIRNPRMAEGVVKIGKTNRSIDERIRELNSPTSNLGQFEPLAYFPVSDMDKAERDCHSALAANRVQDNREFFSGEISKIIEIVCNIARRFPPDSFISPAYSGLPGPPEEKILSVAERLALHQERAALNEENEAIAQAASEKKAHDWATVIRKELCSQSTDIEGVEFFIPNDEPALIVTSGNHFELAHEIAEKRSRVGLVPIARARLFSPNVDAEQILIDSPRRFRQPEGTPELNTTQRRLDDGRLFDLLICPQRMTKGQMEDEVERGWMGMHDGETCLRLVICGFEYFEGGPFHAEEIDFYRGRPSAPPAYCFSGLDASPPLFDPNVVADLFLQVVADNFLKRPQVARYVSINPDDNEQEVEPAYRPNFGSVRW